MFTSTLNAPRNNLVPIRIKQARLARECSMDNLAHDIGVSKQMVSKYETSASKPDINTVIDISRILNFPIDFFYKPMCGEEAVPSAVYFRTTKIPKKVQDAMEQKLNFAQEIISYIEQFISLPEYDNKLVCEDILHLDDPLSRVEEITIQIRNEWGLSDKPINNLTNLLLRKGYIITRALNENNAIDAFSKLIVRPYIILGADKNCAVRSRFDLAHEVGHSFLHFNTIAESDKDKYHQIIEKHANRFASAFLMPASSFAKDIDVVSLDNFVRLKSKWKVSIAAMIKRCFDLCLIDESHYTRLYKALSARGWRSKEPLDDIIEPEIPELFKQAFDIIFNKKLSSRAECVREIALQQSEIEELCFLKKGYFDDSSSVFSKPQLRIVK
jgi:Zn-dependent peptidase ImmA (M78 family)/transcriptional regulator with XRE-family HTH domain